jgi:V/A-type H+-transporting ATPase subunit C
MTEAARQAALDFYTYPPIGGDDWRYTFQTAQVRAMEMRMLSRSALLDMANAPGFEQALDSLTGSEYPISAGTRSFAEVETALLAHRSAVRQLFAGLMLDKRIVALMRSRDDFANLRLALRRVLTEKDLGDDYSPDGNVPPEQLPQLFGEQDEFAKPVFPDYVRGAAERATLAYYQDKDIRRIDYAIDAAQAQYNVARARKLAGIFLLGLFRTQIDLTNIRTLLRIKFTESENPNVFLDGGFIALERFRQGLDLGYEALGALFFVTPYHRLVDTGASYLASEKSFLKIEQQCDEHITGYLRSTVQITAGPQPIIAYLLLKEHEIRTVRLILTAKKNSLDTKLILDRIS